MCESWLSLYYYLLWEWRVVRIALKANGAQIHGPPARRGGGMGRQGDGTTRTIMLLSNQVSSWRRPDQPGKNGWQPPLWMTVELVRCLGYSYIQEYSEAVWGFPHRYISFSYISWNSPSRCILLHTPPLTIHIFGSPNIVVFLQYMSHIQYVFRGYKFRKYEFIESFQCGFTNLKLGFLTQYVICLVTFGLV